MAQIRTSLPIMKSLKSFLAVLCFTFAVPLASPADAPTREQLIGMWLEIHPADNLMYFAKDGTWRMYLKKGEIGDLRTLDGTWTLEAGGKMTYTFKVEDKTIVIKATVSYDGDELELSGEDGTVSRCRRHKGSLPDRFNW